MSAPSWEKVTREDYEALLERLDTAKREYGEHEQALQRENEELLGKVGVLEGALREHETLAPIVMREIERLIVAGDLGAAVETAREYARAVLAGGEAASDDDAMHFDHDEAWEKRSAGVGGGELQLRAAEAADELGWNEGAGREYEAFVAGWWTCWKREPCRCVYPDKCFCKKPAGWGSREGEAMTDFAETPDFFANATDRKEAMPEQAERSTLDEAIADVRESLSYLVTLRSPRTAIYWRILDALELDAKWHEPDVPEVKEEKPSGE